MMEAGEEVSKEMHIGFAVEEAGHLDKERLGGKVGVVVDAVAGDPSQNLLLEELNSFLIHVSSKIGFSKIRLR